jgi:hypothetical protein
MLTANGRVSVINPNGILIQNSVDIKPASFVATPPGHTQRRQTCSAFELKSIETAPNLHNWLMRRRGRGLLALDRDRQLTNA